MLRTLGNLFRAIVLLAILGLVGYYNFESTGIIGAATNALFFAIGIVLVTTWRKKENSVSAQSSEEPSLSEQDTPVNVVAEVGTIGKPKSTKAATTTSESP